MKAKRNTDVVGEPDSASHMQHASPKGRRRTFVLNWVTGSE